MNEETKFPQWGFWIFGAYLESENVTHKRHLFIEKERTACGFNPISSGMSRWLRYRFSAEPKVIGIYEVLSEMERGRMHIADDFYKCKKCQKIENKQRKEI